MQTVDLWRLANKVRFCAFFCCIPKRLCYCLDMTTKYYSGSMELKNCFPMKRALVRAAFPAGTIKKYDDFDLMVGTVDGKYSTTNFLPVTRIVHHNEAGTLHVCGSKCRCAKGGNCECSCGGKFHGVDA